LGEGVEARLRGLETLLPEMNVGGLSKRVVIGFAPDSLPGGVIDGEVDIALIVRTSRPRD
jgi:hypothetical protein